MLELPDIDRAAKIDLCVFPRRPYYPDDGRARPTFKRSSLNRGAERLFIGEAVAIVDLLARQAFRLVSCVEDVFWHADGRCEDRLRFNLLHDPKVNPAVEQQMRGMFLIAVAGMRWSIMYRLDTVAGDRVIARIRCRDPHARPPTTD